MIKTLISLTLAFSVLTSLKAQAKVFELPFMKFSLPDHWQCKTEKAETICTSKQAYETKQTAIVINAKETTPVETIESFYQQLAKPKGMSTVKEIKYVQIGNTKWIEAHQVNSELPNYDTYYWLTRVQNIAVLITYSFATKYSANFEPLAKTLAPSFQLNLVEIDKLSKLAKMAQVQTPEPLVTTEVSPAVQPESFIAKASKVLKSNSTLLVISLCIILLIVALILR